MNERQLTTFQDDKFTEDHKEMLDVLLSYYGPKVVSQLLGMDHWASIQQWVKGKSKPTSWQLRLLRSAHEVHTMVASKKTAKSAKEWMTAVHHDLYGGSPATVHAVNPDLIRIMGMQVLAGTR